MTKINHIGIVVEDINRYVEILERLGGELNKIGHAKKYGAKCAFIDFDNIIIEVIEPDGSDKSKHLKKFLDNSKSPLHHLAFYGKGKKEGALPGMFVDFSKPNSYNKLLIEQVEFK